MSDIDVRYPRILAAWIRVYERSALYNSPVHVESCITRSRSRKKRLRCQRVINGPTQGARYSGRALQLSDVRVALRCAALRCAFRCITAPKKPRGARAEISVRGSWPFCRVRWGWGEEEKGRKRERERERACPQSLYPLTSERRLPNNRSTCRTDRDRSHPRGQIFVRSRFLKRWYSAKE